MKITFKKPNLKKEYLTILVDSDNISDKNKNDISLVTDKIDYYLCIIDKYKLLIDDKRNIPDSVFLNNLSKISNFELAEEDYLNILSNTFNKKYNKIKNIYTNMFANKRVMNRVSYKVAIDEKTNIIDNKIYTLDELNQLIDNNDIILLKEKFIKDKVNKNEIIDKYIKLNITSYDDFLNSQKYIYKYTLKYIRKNISKELLIQKLDDFIKKLKNEINNITNNKYLINNSEIISNNIKEELEEKEITLKLR